MRGRAEHHFTRPAERVVVAQQAADTNAEPMPILPRRPTVALPSDLSQCQPAARALIKRGLEVDEDDEDDGWLLDPLSQYYTAAAGNGSPATSRVSAAGAAAPWGALAAAGASTSAAPRLPHGTAGDPSDAKRFKR